MRLALQKAKIAAEKSEVPVGAVLVCNNQIIATAHNNCETNHNPLQHAEIIVLNSSINTLKKYYLDDCDLYVTLEPCTMCAASIAQARIRKLIFGAYDIKSGGVEHGAKVFLHTHHKPEIIGGVLELESQHLLKNFFAHKR
jgi:tRNA(adenine34) deaminase